MRRDQLVEALLESDELFLNAHFEAPLHVEMDVVLLVFIGDWDVLAVGFQVIGCDLAELVVLDAEGGVKHAFYVIFPVGTMVRLNKVH